MSTADAPPAAPSGDLAWRVVGLANLYRLLLPPVLFALYLFTRPTPTVGGTNPQLFVLVCIVYWALGALFAFGGRGHWPSRRVLGLAPTLLDPAAGAALLYCSGTRSHFWQCRRLVGNHGCWRGCWPIGTIWLTGGM